LVADQVGCKVVLKLKYTPWLPWFDISLSSPDQCEISDNGYRNRFLNTVDMLGDLMFSQAQPAFELFKKNLYGPSSLVKEKHLSCCQVHEIGHQYLSFLGAHVTPFFAQHDGDVSKMTKASALSEYPKGLSAVLVCQSRNPSSFEILVRDVFGQVLQAFAVFHFPGSRNGKHKGPATGLVGSVHLRDQSDIGFGSKRRIRGDHHKSGPARRLEVRKHLTKKLVFCSVAWVSFGQDDAEIHRNAIDIPTDHQQHKLDTEEIGFMLACPPFLRHGIPLAPFVFLAAVADDINHLVLRFRQRSDGGLGEPPQKNAQAPISGGKQTPEMPFCNMRGGNSSEPLQCSLRMLSVNDGLILMVTEGF